MFNYDQLDPETADFVKARTAALKLVIKPAAKNVIEIGRHLLEVKERLGHGHFLRWLQAEFPGWSDRSAQRYMRLAESFKNDNLSDLKVSVSVLYLLAAPSTPEPARQEIIDLAQNGQAVTVAEARQIIAGHREDNGAGATARVEYAPPVQDSQPVHFPSAVPVRDPGPPPPDPEEADIDGYLADTGDSFDEALDEIFGLVPADKVPPEFDIPDAPPPHTRIIRIDPVTAPVWAIEEALLRLNEAYYYQTERYYFTPPPQRRHTRSDL